MSKWIVDIHGDIEGDYEIIEKYEEPKTGHWINHKDEHQCSQCEETVIADEDVWEEYSYDYCPNCGAKMESEDKE